MSEALSSPRSPDAMADTSPPPSDVPPADSGPRGSFNKENDGTHDIPVTIDLLQPILSGDQIYVSLKSHFLMQGKGRRPKLPSLDAPTHRLVAQLYCLKQESLSSWENVMSWFTKLFPEQPLTTGQLRHRTTKVVLCCQTYLPDDQEGLSNFLDVVMDFDELVPTLGDIGLSRSLLSGKPLNFIVPCDLIVTNGLVWALEMFRNKEKLPASYIYPWISHLLSNSKYATKTESQIRHVASLIFKKVKGLKKKKELADQLDSYLSQAAFEKVCLDSTKDSENKNETVVPGSQGCDCRFTIKQLKHDVSSLTEKMKAVEGKAIDEEMKNEILREERDNLRLLCDKEIINLSELENLRASNKKLKAEIRAMKSVRGYKNKRNQHLQERNNILLKEQASLKDKLKISVCEQESLQSLISHLKAKIKCEQVQKSKYKVLLKKEKDTCQTLIKLSDLEKEEIALRQDNSHRFTDNIRLAYMALQGEANVAASNCAKVVQIVSKHLFNKTFELRDLPCKSSALNFADEGHILAKQHIAEKISKSKHFTYACDGTSRQKQHFLEKHIVLDNGKVMSLGYSEIATDDADTLLEACVDSFKELAKVTAQVDKSISEDELLKNIVRKMKCLMSDRAAVMKSFDSKMGQFKKDLLDNEDASTHFLFCNAHFLIGLATSIEEGLKTMEENLVREDNKKLGRDESTKFSRFSSTSETAGFRIIRTTADILGPRGDEKSGCRQEWLAYCSLVGKKSTFTSYRSNRFNCVFENATATLSHQADVQDFISNYVSHSNLKLQSVLEDLQDNRILCILGALCLFHLFFTGPYWKLMNSSTPYGKFPQYARKMESALSVWSARQLSVQEIHPVFDDYDIQTVPDFIQSAGIECQNIIMTFFCELCKRAFAVFKRQLADFLDGGVFGGDIAPDVQQILDSCPLTNLTGERQFGDLDFDIHKRRSASIHLRSTINMWKHNGTSTWISKQRFQRRRSLLSNAVKHGPEWRLMSRKQQIAVRQKIKARIEQNKIKKNEVAIKLAERKAATVDVILAHGGVCCTKDDVDRLLHGPNALENLKAQLRFRKLFYGENLLISGNKKALYTRLLSRLGHSHHTSNSTTPPKKRAKTANS